MLQLFLRSWKSLWLGLKSTLVLFRKSGKNLCQLTAVLSGITKYQKYLNIPEIFQLRLIVWYICLVYYNMESFIQNITKLSEKSFTTSTCAYQGVRNVSFSENFAYVLNKWSLLRFINLLQGNVLFLYKTFSIFLFLWKLQG